MSKSRDPFSEPLADADADDFLIELDEDLVALADEREQTVASPLPEPEAEAADDDDGEFAALDGLDAFGDDDTRAQPQPTMLMQVPELDEPAPHDADLFADIQRAKEAGVSLASARIEHLPDSPQALISVSDGRDPVPITKSVMIIGRGEEVSDIVLQSEKVSRQHAAVIFARGEFFIEDLNSTNGTLIQGKRVKRVRLPPGLSVRIGSFLLQISWNI